MLLWEKLVLRGALILALIKQKFRELVNSIDDFIESMHRIDNMEL